MSSKGQQDPDGIRIRPEHVDPKPVPRKSHKDGRQYTIGLRRKRDTSQNSVTEDRDRTIILARETGSRDGGRKYTPCTFSQTITHA